MDEEDGRPGAVARKSGHVDAHTDVPTVSLRHAHPTPCILSEINRRPEPSPSKSKQKPCFGFFRSSKPAPIPDANFAPGVENRKSMPVFPFNPAPAPFSWRGPSRRPSAPLRVAGLSPVIGPTAGKRPRKT